MRYELVHFLSHVEDERIITAFIQNFTIDDLETLICHLEYTDPATRERWLNLCNKTLHFWVN
ncbi:hypothetical protein [Paenibacillus periandrae]|uniref:hypothetical protein n=1 Tax=Paenibacillus periandrae TaxID=1761741 RepID=UPI001F0950E6|nr:hypothetical protein [Paenibacillus periandrae]